MIQYLTVSQVSDALHLKERTIKEMVKKGIFPPPVRVSWNRAVWDPNDIEAWANERKMKENIAR